MAATATGIPINFSPASSRRCSYLGCRASKSEIDEPDVIFQGHIDDEKYLAKLAAGSVLALLQLSTEMPSTPSISQTLLMISSPVVIAVLLLIQKSSVEKKETETIRELKRKLCLLARDLNRCGVKSLPFTAPVSGRTVIYLQSSGAQRIPEGSEYAYGSSGFPAWGIQPNSTLIFEIEVLKFE